MKTKKALRRLAKIEVAIVDVTERFSESPPQIRELLNDLKAAFARVKEAVTPPPRVKKRKQTRKVAGKTRDKQASRKAASTRKTAAKKASAKGSGAKTAGKSGSARKAARKRAVKKPFSVPAAAPTALEEHAQNGAAVRSGNPRVSGQFGGADGAL